MQGRKDNKGRILNKGEHQEPSGRYFYQYTDVDGKRKRVTAWRLNPSDRTPPGKRMDKCLREKEAEINVNRDNGIVSSSSLTIEQLCSSYLEKYSSSMAIGTVESHRGALNNLRKYALHRRKACDMKVSDAKKLMQDLVSKYHMTFSQVRKIKSLLSNAFQMAYEDDLIRKNPFQFRLNCIKDLAPLKSREALSPAEKERLLEFVQNSGAYSRHYDALLILLGTGLRIGEFCGLTLDDLDLDRGFIRVRRQLRKYGANTVVWSPKSEAGVRMIPLSDEVRAAFVRVLSKRKPMVEPVVDGVSGFVFINSIGSVTDPKGVWGNFNRLQKAYNAKQGEEIKLSPHILRHTFCSDCVRKGMDSKVLQTIMGHESCKTTLDVYTHITQEEILTEFKSKMC